MPSSSLPHWVLSLAVTVALAMLLSFAALGIWWLRRRRYELVLFAAFLEQARREQTHRVAYRPDQQVHAMQQRLARHLGAKRAFSRSTEADIRAGLGL